MKAGSLQNTRQLGVEPSPSTRDAGAPVHLRFDPPIMYLFVEQASAALNITFPEAQRNDEFYLVADVYLHENPVHPDGHIGWWSFSLSGTAMVSLALNAVGGQVEILAGGIDRLGCWVNGNIDLPEAASLLVHLVLRQRFNDSIAHMQSLLVYRDAAVAEAATLSRTDLTKNWATVANLLPAFFNLPTGSTVRIVVQSLAPASQRRRGSTVALQLLKLFTREGIIARLYAFDFDPALRGSVLHVGDLGEDARPEDILLILYDDQLVTLPWLTSLPCIKIFYFLGLPNFDRLQVFDAELHQRYVKAEELMTYAAHCEFWAVSTNVQRAQFAKHLLSDASEIIKPKVSIKSIARNLLPRLAPQDRLRLTSLTGFGAELTSDERAVFEAAIIRQTRSCPLPDRTSVWASLQDIEPPVSLTDETLLLFQGMLSPGEGVVAVLEVFEAFLNRTGGGQLVIAGYRPVAAFIDYIEHLLATRFLNIRDHVTLLIGLGDGPLKALYRCCDALVHLGPEGAERLEEAVYFNKPLFTGEKAATRSGYRLYGTDREAQASRIAEVLTDQSARAILIKAQQVYLSERSELNVDLSILDILEIAGARIQQNPGIVL